MMAMLQDLGYSTAQIKNIASSTASITGSEMAARVKDFKTNPKTNVILIDRNSSSGFNLNEGQVLHVVGAPDSGATFLQAQGRLARMPRKGNVEVKTYRYSDDVTNMGHWNNLDAQLKVLRASSPGLFIS